MALVVDQYELGPIGTNCYVVRSERGATEAAVVDPSGDAATIRLELAGMGATCAGILVTHSHWDHILGLADLAEGTGATVYGCRGGRSSSARTSTTPGWACPCAAASLTRCSRAARRSRSRASPSRSWLFPATLRATSPTTRTARCSPETCSSRVRSAAPTFPTATGTTLLESIRALADRFPPETVVYPGHGPATTLGAELERNPFLAELRSP